MYTLLCAGFVVLAGCNQSPAPVAGPAGTSTAPSAASAPAPAQSTAAQAAPYTPPTADQLYQLVAPIALFPDNLVAQVLAGSTFPDQITAADNFLTQNPGLKGAPLQAQVNTQPWDASVKSLTTFPSVLDQMARNAQWTSALGEAYVNDPTDVMNAIQVMRQRASQKGNLRSTVQQVVQTQPATAADNATYADDGQQPAYDGPSVVEAPPQYIEIAPAQQDTVYVPSYDPQTVYGGDVPVYPSYSYQPQGYSTGEIVTAGAITFGAGILIGSLLEGHHHDGGGYNNYNNQPPPGGGWHSWGMNWGGRGAGGGRQRPAVIHNNSTYVSNSTTVVNRYTTNNVNNSRTTINNVNNVNNSRNQAVQNRNVGNQTANNFPRPAANENPATTPRGGMSMPHFGNTPQQGATAAAGSRQPQHVANNLTRPAEGAPHAGVHTEPARAPVTTPNREVRPEPVARPPQSQPQPQHEAARPMPQHASPVVQHEAAPRLAPRPVPTPHAVPTPRQAPPPREAAPLRQPPAPRQALPPREAAPPRQPAAPRQAPAPRPKAHPAPPAHPNTDKNKKDDKNDHS
jgi:Protein of unknown function (DUF3300)